jgi:hypothetical protein
LGPKVTSCTSAQPRHRKFLERGTRRDSLLDSTLLIPREAPVERVSKHKNRRRPKHETTGESLQSFTEADRFCDRIGFLLRCRYRRRSLGLNLDNVRLDFFHANDLAEFNLRRHDERRTTAIHPQHTVGRTRNQIVMRHVTSVIRSAR